MRQITLIISVFALAIAAPAIAGKGGNGNGNGGSSGGGGGSVTASGSCTVSGNVVTGSGLPTDQVLNFMVSDANRTWGWVLGYSDGSWAVTVPNRTSPTTYEFAGRMSGPNGSKYAVFASCSA